MGRFRFRLNHVPFRSSLLFLALGLVLATSACTGLVDKDLMATFFADLGDTSMVVYPVYVKRMAFDATHSPLGRDAVDSAYDRTEAQRLAEFLECEKLAKVSVASEDIPWNTDWQRSQQAIYKAGARAFGRHIATHPIDAEYAMIAEYLIPRDKVWAVHAYVVNAAGEPVWILHLNEHFDVFTRISPNTPQDATEVLLAFLRTGWPVVQRVQESDAAASSRIGAGVLDDFETGLPEGTDPHGIALGFSTFNGPASSASIARVGSHPPRPGEAAGNNVLELDIDVRDWAGFVHFFENPDLDTWIPLDWRGLEGFRFWMFGNNTGARMNVDVIDNRHACASRDDAERYRYEFADNFHGWKQVSVPFSSMVRAEIGNRAPNDGLGLGNVHGWGIGSATRGRAIYYFDDFELVEEL